MSFCSIVRWFVMSCHMSMCHGYICQICSVNTLCTTTNDWSSTTAIIFVYFCRHDCCGIHIGHGIFTTKRLRAVKNDGIAKNVCNHWLLSIIYPTLGVPPNCNNNPTHWWKSYLQTISNVLHYHTTFFGAMFDFWKRKSPQQWHLHLQHPLNKLVPNMSILWNWISIWQWQSYMKKIILWNLLC